MAKPSSKDEIVQTFHGINRTTFDVESVWMTSGRKLTKMGRDGSLTSHLIEGGRDPKTEVVIKFGLIEVFSVSQALSGGQLEKRGIEELTAKAAEMKKAADEKKSGGES